MDRILSQVSLRNLLSSVGEGGFETLDAEELATLARSSAGAGIWDVDLQSGEVRLCPVSLRMHNLPEDLPMPMAIEAWEAAIEPGSASGARQRFEHAISSGENFTVEFQIRETQRWILGSGRVVKDRAGKPVRFMGLNQDVTELKASKLMIAQMQTQLIHLSRVSAMGTMASTIAHELNQPLAAISLYAAAGRKMLGDGDRELAMILENIGEASARAGAVIRHLRAAIKRQDPTFEPVSLREIVDSAMDLALLDARQEGVTVEVKVPRNLKVKGDRIQLEQVVLNLLRNGIEAMEGCPAKHLSVVAHKLAERIILDVADTGRGLSPQVLSSLFEPFETTKSSGMGIGLSICRTIIEAHQGTIGAQPNEREGATFSIDLPAA